MLGNVVVVSMSVSPNASKNSAFDFVPDEMSIGVAGYPEGYKTENNVDQDMGQVTRYLKQKVVESIAETYPINDCTDKDASFNIPISCTLLITPN